jgi:hypothetical protein
MERHTDPRRGLVWGHLCDTLEARGGLRRKAGLTEESGKVRVGVRIVRMRLNDGAHRAESLVERASGFQGARLGDPSRHCPRRCFRRGPEGCRRLGAQLARQVECAKPQLDVDEIRLQRDRRLIARHRLVDLALALEDIAEVAVSRRQAGVQTESGGECIGRLFWPPRGHQGHAEVMA